MYCFVHMQPNPEQRICGENTLSLPGLFLPHPGSCLPQGLSHSGFSSFNRLKLWSLPPWTAEQLCFTWAPTLHVSQKIIFRQSSKVFMVLTSWITLLSEIAFLYFCGPSSRNDCLMYFGWLSLEEDLVMMMLEVEVPKFFLERFVCLSPYPPSVNFLSFITISDIFLILRTIYFYIFNQKTSLFLNSYVLDFKNENHRNIHINGK